MNLNHTHAASFFNKLENIYGKLKVNYFSYLSGIAPLDPSSIAAKKYNTRNKNINEGMPSIGHPFTTRNGQIHRSKETGASTDNHQI